MSSSRFPLRGTVFALTVVALACSGAPNPEPPQVPEVREREVYEIPPDVVPVESEELPGEAEPRDDVPAKEPARPRKPAETPEPIDSQALLEDSLAAYEQAQEVWSGGDVDGAIAALDQAYYLMGSVPSNGDPAIAQQKEDVRRLISRKLVEIYASRQTAAGDLSGSIPVEINEKVEREIESFQGPERDAFMAGYERSGLYRPMIVEKMRAAGIPEELSWLPMVESWFKIRAFSTARALGLWQFIASTGYRFGLERTWWVDERMDPEKSTDAAIAYLTELHALFGDWMLALAGYNSGEHNVLRRIHRQPEGYLDRFWDVQEMLPRETRRFAPRFLAVLAIVNDPEKYGFDLPEPLDPIPTTVVEIDRPTRTEDLDRVMGFEVGTLADLNPELRRKATPDGSYPLKVPAAHAEDVVARLANLPEWVPPVDVYTTYRVRRGDTLSGIASRYGTSVAVLMDINSLRSANRLSIGQAIRVPDRRPAPTRSASALGPGESVTHSVRTGDTLWLLASRYGTTVDRIKRENALSSDVLQPGQALTISSAQQLTGETYTVRRGDTLGKIATQLRVPLNSLLAANGLSTRSTIYPGQRLAVPR